MAGDGTLQPGEQGDVRGGGQPDELLTVAEAVRRYNFAPDVLRRRLATGGIPGAERVATDTGQDWLIPSSALAALGYRRVDEDAALRREAPVAQPERPPPRRRAPGEPAVREQDENGLESDLKGQWDALKAERRRLEAERVALQQEQEAIRQDLEDVRRAIRAERRALRAERRQLEVDRRQLRSKPGQGPPTPGESMQQQSEGRAQRRRGPRGVPEPAVTPARQRAWVEPEGDVCPSTHPVKASLGSGRYRLPGMLGYERARPDRCYRTEQAAEDDGFTPARR